MTRFKFLSVLCVFCFYSCNYILVDTADYSDKAIKPEFLWSFKHDKTNKPSNSLSSFIFKGKYFHYSSHQIEPGSTKLKLLVFDIENKIVLFEKENQSDYFSSNSMILIDNNLVRESNGKLKKLDLDLYAESFNTTAINLFVDHKFSTFKGKIFKPTKSGYRKCEKIQIEVLDPNALDKAYLLSDDDLGIKTSAWQYGNLQSLRLERAKNGDTILYYRIDFQTSSALSTQVDLIYIANNITKKRKLWESVDSGGAKKVDELDNLFPPIIISDRVVFTSNTTAKCFDKNTGKLIWSLPLKNSYNRSYVVENNFLYYVEGLTHLIKIDLVSGEIASRIPLNGYYSSALIKYNGQIYISTVNRIIVIDYNTMKVNWVWDFSKINSSYEIESFCIDEKNNQIYIGTKKEILSIKFPK